MKPALRNQRGGLNPFEEVPMEPTAKVVITVLGGVAEVESCPDDIDVEIIDYDDLGAEESRP